MATRESYSKLELMQARVKEVPRGWNFSDIGRVFSIKNNLRRPISEAEREKNPGVYPYYGPTKVQGFIGTYEQDGSYALIGEDGDHFLKYRTQKMTQLVDGKCTVNNHAHIIQESKVATREWFYYYFMHRDIFSFLSRQGAGRFKLNKASLEKIPLLVPPVVEQKKIAQILSTWDKAITTTERLLANSQQQKKALMQQLLTGKKRLLDENGVRYSGKWINGRLGDLLVFKGGSAFKEKYQGNSVGDLPFIKVSDMNIVGNEKYINRANNWVSQNEATLMKAYPFDENTIVFAKVGAALRLNRRRILATPTIIDNNMMAAIPRQTSDTEFLYQLLLAIDFAKFVQDGAVPSVNQSDLNAFKITYPDFDERQKIAKVLATAEKQSKELKQTLLVLKNEKKALMQQLLTGKRRVKVDEEAA